MTPLPYDVVLAHHALVIAIPFFVPALLVVAAVGAVVWRDRHLPPDETADGEAASGGADRPSE